ncbi:hypothetical protein JCM10908_005869 [Rhodotorula pacifica]|uniref:uncharacterized protein n=1 Tax=Rhodotorula pacifica TaxID=1495444 RepID=UPI00316D2CB3
MRLSRCFPPATRPPDPLSLSTGWRTQLQRQPPPPPAVAAKRAPAQAPSQTPPPVIARAREAAASRAFEQHQPVASTSKSSTAVTAQDRAQSELERLVQSFPVAHKVPRVSHRPNAQVQAEIATWRRACVAAHTALSSLKHARQAVLTTAASVKGKGRAVDMDGLGIPPELERKVVRLVGETMQLLLHLGHVQAAADLDRAFFTTRAPSRSERRRKPASSSRSEGKVAAQEEEGFSLLGDGLGLQRGKEHLAWMQAMTVSLQQGGGMGAKRLRGKGAGEGQQRKALRDVEALLAGAREQAGGPGPPRSALFGEGGVTPPSDLLAFAARHMGAVQHLVQTTTASSSSTTSRVSRSSTSSDFGDEIRSWLSDVRRAECEQGDELVSMALLESGLGRLEQALEANEKRVRAGGASGQGPLMQKVEEDIEWLVRSLEAPRSYPSAAKQPTSKQVSRHAHILALAIRFLLFRHRLAPIPPPPPPTPRGSAVVDPLLSASQLYAVLLKIPIPTPPSAAILADVRARQTSSLFRLLDAHLTAAATAQQQQRQQYQARILELLELTLDRVRVYEGASAEGGGTGGAAGNGDKDVERRALRLGVSARTYQRLLRLLAEPFRPRSTPSHSSYPRHHHPHHHQHLSRQFLPQAAFAVLSRALEVIARCRTYDSRFSSSPSFPAGGDRHTSAQAVFSHPKTTIHFVRAWFAARSLSPADHVPPPPPSHPLAAHSPSSSSPSYTDHNTPSPTGSEIAYRLQSLLDFVDSIDPAAAATTTATTTRARSRSRRVVARAVREVVEQRWGSAHAPASMSSRGVEQAGRYGDDKRPAAATSEEVEGRSWRDLVVETRLSRWLDGRDGADGGGGNCGG